MGSAGGTSIVYGPERGGVPGRKQWINPLSVLTPGMFREIFRQRPPNLKDAEGGGG